MEFVEIKNFCSSKDTVKSVKSQAIDWEKMFAKDTYDKRLFSKIDKNVLKLNNKKMNNQIKRWAKNLNRHPTKEDVQMANWM